MKETERNWERELRQPPTADRFSEDMWLEVERKLQAKPNPFRFMKPIVGAACAVMLAILAVYYFPAEQADYTTTSGDPVYAQIEDEVLRDLYNDPDIEMIHEYRGHTDNWAVVYVDYHRKGEALHTERVLYRYIGDGPKPTGRISYYSYSQPRGVQTGSSSVSAAETHDWKKVFEFGSSGHGGGPETISAYYQIQLNWNRQTEEIKLFNANPSQQTTVLGIAHTCDIPPREIRTSDGRFYRLYNESTAIDPAVKLESVTCKEGVFERTNESSGNSNAVYTITGGHQLLLVGNWGRALYTEIELDQNTSAQAQNQP
ncbi:hypothetical protein [Paenibacillus xanthanilyticus]|uniref:DUF4367 domain-containing protein n=1 Tax=Paenibacillus xanthanilyticus TaxID=1783531 RepID=A0ABV8KDP9_9BACL